MIGRDRRPGFGNQWERVDRITGMELNAWKQSNRLVVGLLLLAFAGCAPEAHFTLNSVYLAKQERDTKQALAQRKAEIGDVLTAMFGTPDKPMVPELDGIDV